MSVVVSALVWLLHLMAAHPTETVMVLCAGASLLVEKTKNVPVIGKFMALASQFGINLPGLWANLKAKAPAEVAKLAAAEATKLSGK